MKEATVHVDIVTPCFLGGANQAAGAEWRAQSIRGQLRWWFRAVTGGELGGDLEATRRAEAEAFGSTERQSKIRARATDRPAIWPAKAKEILGRRLNSEQLTTTAGYSPRHPLFDVTMERLRIGKGGADTPSNPVQYLGYGCVGLRGLDRSCLRPDQATSFRLSWHDRGPRALSKEVGALVTKSLWAWLSLGAIGSKARNGFGSLQWLETKGELPGTDGEPFGPASTRGALKNGVLRLLDGVTAKGEPDWSHFGPESKVFIAREGAESWDEAMVKVGAWMIVFRRRYGLPDDRRKLRDDRVPAGRDYAWASPKAGRTRREGLPDRAGFGLPLPFGEHGEMAVWSPAGNQQGGGGDRRRAAPLQVHVGKLDGEWVPVLTYLPARFLPEGASIQYKDYPETAAPPNKFQRGIVEDFLEDLRTRGMIRRVEP